MVLSLRDSTNITHLRFIQPINNLNDLSLSEIFLSDMGPVPASLQYITCVTRGKFHVSSRVARGKDRWHSSKITSSGLGLLYYHWHFP
jgi:hypothetical protein